MKGKSMIRGGKEKRSVKEGRIREGREWWKGFILEAENRKISIGSQYITPSPTRAKCVVRGEPMMYSFSPNFYLIVLYGLPREAKIAAIPQYDVQVVDFRGSCTHLPSSIRAQFGRRGDTWLAEKITRTVNYGASSLQNDLLHVKRLQLHFLGRNLAPRIEMGVFGRSSTLLKYSNVTCTVIAALKALLKLYILRQLQSS